MDGLRMKYFVLRPKAKSKDDVHAKASQHAMLVYTVHIREVNPDFASEVEAWAMLEATRQNRMKGGTTDG